MTVNVESNGESPSRGSGGEPTSVGRRCKELMKQIKNKRLDIRVQKKDFWGEGC